MPAQNMELNLSIQRQVGMLKLSKHKIKNILKNKMISSHIQIIKILSGQAISHPESL
jgi:hypothetical protein